MNRRIIVNRWFRANGQRKRVDALFEHFWTDAEALKDWMFNFDYAKIVKYIRVKYKVTLHEATAMMVAFIGHYDNDKQSVLFTKQRYDRGEELWKHHVG